MTDAAHKPRHFSMIRTFVLADVLTLGNGCCGAGSVLALMQFLATGDSAWLWWAMALSPLALVLDFADGRVARALRRASPLGADLDSLADVISFGMAPAALGFALGLRTTLDICMLLYFVTCGISRLARFNITAVAMSNEDGKVSHFEGAPIPTSVILVCVFAMLTALGKVGAQLPFGCIEFGPLSWHPLALMYVASGSAMVSRTLRIPKL